MTLKTLTICKELMEAVTFRVQEPLAKERIGNLHEAYQEVLLEIEKAQAAIADSIEQGKIEAAEYDADVKALEAKVELLEKELREAKDDLNDLLHY